MDQISTHLSYKEATRSDTAIRHGISNDPPKAQLANIVSWATNVFEPIQDAVNKKRGKDSPLIKNSIYRSPAVNAKVGGSPTSSHCAGEKSLIEEGAGDIEAHFPDFTNKDLFLLIKEKGAFDQLIAEFKDGDQPAWIHVSWRKANRRQILIAEKVDGHTVYHPFSPETWTRIYG